MEGLFDFVDTTALRKDLRFTSARDLRLLSEGKSKNNRIVIIDSMPAMLVRLLSGSTVPNRIRSGRGMRAEVSDQLR